MNAQPQSGIPIELLLTCFRVSGNLRIQQLSVTFTLSRRSVSVDDRLHDSAGAENRGWTKRQNVARRAALSFVSFSDHGTAGLKLIDVVLEDRFRKRN